MILLMTRTRLLGSQSAEVLKNGLTQRMKWT